MSKRQMKVASRNGSAPALSLYDIGRKIVALSDIHDAYDTQELERGLPSPKRLALEKAKSIVWRQEETLVDLGLAMVPETVPDVVAQLVLADRRLDWLVACDLERDEMQKIAADVIHVIRSSLPLLARAAQIDLAEVVGEGQQSLIDAERPETGGPD